MTISASFLTLPTANKIAALFLYMRLNYLIHASCVESHDGGVCQSVEHCPEHLLAVQRGVLQEDLVDELLVEHGAGDVVENCWQINIRCDRYF